ncbi:hypothetical protein [Ruminiclostridium cellobioparum]|uniref:hypothetical protein n=1 Tax=Ruminiclostridium cellobioparum TaxID=29355 RepID=UPI0004850712|nr:hypothetical protein [Ruminiclostridium cellobioparum]
MEHGGNGAIDLNNGRLSVRVSYPGEVYRGSRFDWNGFITQVTLDDRYTFCVPEALVPGVGSGGQGFCGEFGNEQAIGYEETYVDNYFIKIGVGNLKKIDNKPYDFFRNYPVVPLAGSVTSSTGRVCFKVESGSNDGYSYTYNKDIKIDENFLTISYMLKNTGSKKFETTEYCHNFVGINNEFVSDSYELKIPGCIIPENIVGEIVLGESTITWPENGVEQEFYCVLKNYENAPEYSWELFNHKTGAGIREAVDFEVAKFALWGSRHVISPETFIRLELAPGQTATWTRRYEFFY